MRARNIDVAAVRTFLKVAEMGQVTAAAHLLNMTQSAASQQIHRLESQLGVKLFERTPNRIKLSVNGEIFYNKAKQIIRINDDVMHEFNYGSNSQEVKLGVPHDLVERIMPSILRDIHQNGISIDVKLVSLSSGNLYSLLRAEKIDITLITDVAGTGEGEVLMEDRLVWAGAPGGRASFETPLVVALGDGSDHFAGPARRALDASNLPWKAIRQEGGLGAVFAMLAADRAIAPFLRCAVPSILGVLEHDRLPSLPHYHIKLIPHLGRITPNQQTIITAIRNHFL